MKAAFLIAAPMSGSGKTTVARGLMALFTKQGLRVQPFKCGPDYIDTKFHEAVCHRPSINLDTFMASEQHVRDLFLRYTQGGDEAPVWASEPADVAIVEGMMGLFDGYERDRGSCADIARVLDIPIVLVVDARSAAYSMAALLQGFTRFRPDLHFAGVIFNKVGSQRHATMLREVADEVGIPCLGCIPKAAALEQGSRYLGLDFSASCESEELVDILSNNLDRQWLQKICSQPHRPILLGASANSIGRIGQFYWAHQETSPERPDKAPKRILVARNAESFSFIYAEAIDRLGQIGEVAFFDPEEIMDEESIGLRSQDTLLYLPGGYPEKHLEALLKAERTRLAIRYFAAGGGRIIAECGGMMYLCKEIITDECAYPMCGVLPYSITARSADRRLSLGYRRFTVEGHELRGHEFHYTRFIEPLPASWVQVYNAKGDAVPTPVMREGNVVASYTHLSPSALMDIILSLF